MPIDRRETRVNRVGSRPCLASPFLLPYRVLVLRARVLRPITLPAFPGSALRGVFGHALRRLACLTQAPTCKDCLLRSRCTYARVFEPQPPEGARRLYSQVPAGFVLAPPVGLRPLESGELLEFGLTLVGAGLSDAPLVLAAWRDALMLGLGPSKGTATLDQVIDCPVPDAGPAPSQVTLRFITPTYIKRGGQPLGPDQLTGAAVLRAAVRRVGDLLELQDNQHATIDFASLGAAADRVRVKAAALAWADIERWSNRHHRHMSFRGVVGRLDVAGDLDMLWPFLFAGQYLHVGGKTSFGLGRYLLQGEAWPAASVAA